MEAISLSWQDLVLSLFFILIFGMAGVQSGRRGKVGAAITSLVTCVILLALLVTD